MVEEPPRYIWQCENCGEQGTARSRHPIPCKRCKRFVYPQSIICREPEEQAGPKKCY